MRDIRLVARLQPDLLERIERHRDVTGVPTSEFVRRLLKKALDEFEAESHRGRRKSPHAPNQV